MTKQTSNRIIVATLFFATAALTAGLVVINHYETTARFTAKISIEKPLKPFSKSKTVSTENALKIDRARRPRIGGGLRNVALANSKRDGGPGPGSR